MEEQIENGVCQRRGLKREVERKQERRVVGRSKVAVGHRLVARDCQCWRSFDVTAIVSQRVVFLLFRLSM